MHFPTILCVQGWVRWQEMRFHQQRFQEHPVSIKYIIVLKGNGIFLITQILGSHGYRG